MENKCNVKNTYADQIEKACKEFRTLLTEQLQRQDRMENKAGSKKLVAKGNVTIGLCGGDGIGPIIMRQAERILYHLFEEEIAKGTITIKNIEGLTIENRTEKGEAVPSDVLEEIKKCDVILKGPTTTPKGGNMGSANVTLRRELDLYANVRPVKVAEEGIDWTFFRENTEGEYVLGGRGIEIENKLAMDFKVTTKSGTERIARAAFDYAKNNGKTKVAIVTKANVVKKTDGNFSNICHEVAKEYEGIEAEDWYIDIMTAKLIDKEKRKDFQVFVLPNLYGDIITDEAAEIQGGVGTAGSANIGDDYAMFEAIHGSAPRMIERGYGECANPSSVIKAAEMMIRHIGYADKADKLAGAMEICNEKERRIAITGRPTGATCEEFADYVMEKL